MELDDFALKLKKTIVLPASFLGGGADTLKQRMPRVCFSFPTFVIATPLSLRFGLIPRLHE